MAARRDYDIQIDLELDEPSRSSPALGQIDRMLKRSALETQSLHVVRRLMMRDMLDRAQVTGITKLAAAADLREKHTLGLPPADLNGNGAGKRGPYKKTKNKKTGVGARAYESLAKTNIVGPRLNLFVLEHLDRAGRFVDGSDILKALKDTGHADHIKRLSGVFGLMSMEGFTKHTDEGYKITASGRNFAKQMRTKLETTGQVIPGQYLAPADYRTKSTNRLGYKTMGQHMLKRRKAASA